MWLSALGALMVFGLAVVLTPLWGSVGTAVAVTISFAVIAAALLWALRRYVLSPNHARWNLRRVGITAAVSVVLSAVALLASLPEAVQPERGVLSVFSWAVGVALLAVASGGKETWTRILRRADVTGSGRV